MMKPTKPTNPQNSMPAQADVVICGAGIAGIASAYFLVVHHGVRNVLLVDERPPLTLTSDKSTEAYRNWWPGPGTAMVSFMNRSIDLLEELAVESDNVFLLNRRGYLYLTNTAEGVQRFQETARQISALGAGSVREHPGREPYHPTATEGFANQPAGADLLLDPALIAQHFPFLAGNVQAALHARRCGWLSAQQLGMYLLEQAQAAGVRFVSGRVQAVQVEKGRVVAVQVNGERIATGAFVNAAGPYLRQVGEMVGVALPVHNELHGKLAFTDHLGLIPRDVPMIIWDEPLSLPWMEAEREELAAYADTRWLLEELPAGLHFRPEGGEGSPIVLMLWPYHMDICEPPVWPPPALDEFFPDVVLRGMMRLIPALEAYIGRAGRPVIDSGYYCKTVENRPLIGPLPVGGAYVVGALSGYGIMAAPAAGELLSAHLTGSELPDYAPAFLLSRYEDPAYQGLLAEWGDSGQL